MTPVKCSVVASRTGLGRTGTQAGDEQLPGCRGDRLLKPSQQSLRKPVSQLAPPLSRDPQHELASGRVSLI